MKKFALLLCSTQNQMFAVGNILIGFKKYFSLEEKDYDIIILVDKVSKNDEIVLRKIHENIIIKKFDNPFSKSFLNSNPGLNWTYMAFARFEGFDLVQNYEQLLYVDTDVLIKKDLVSLLNFKDKIFYAPSSDVELRQTASMKFFVANYNINKYDLSKKLFTSAVILFNNNKQNNQYIKEWLYKAAEKFISCDMFVFNCAIQEFNLDIGILDPLYESNPFVKNVDEAYIIHACDKFWDKVKNEEWEENNKKWIELGGTKYDPLYVKKKKELINKLVWFIPNLNLRNKMRIKLAKKFGFRWQI